jgi:hypothetical protein
LRGIEAIDSPYEAHLSGGPDQQEFFLTVTRQSLLAQRIVGFELHFVALTQLTQVELREGHRDGQALAQQAWPSLTLRSAVATVAGFHRTIPARRRAQTESHHWSHPNFCICGGDLLHHVLITARRS